MFEILKRKIERKDYKLETMIEKIRILFADDEITKEEKDELEKLARENANAENSYAPLQEQIDNTNIRIDSLEERISKLENTKGTGEEGTEEPVEPVEEYPEYKQPTGAHDAYKIGDKITYNGKKYICKMDGCVWTPDAYPAGWEEVVETVESEG